MTDLVPVETTNLGRADDPAIAWSRVREVLSYARRGSRCASS